MRTVKVSTNSRVLTQGGFFSIWEKFKTFIFDVYLSHKCDLRFDVYFAENAERSRNLELSYSLLILFFPNFFYISSCFLHPAHVTDISLKKSRKISHTACVRASNAIPARKMYKLIRTTAFQVFSFPWLASVCLSFKTGARSLTCELLL